MRGRLAEKLARGHLSVAPPQLPSTPNARAWVMPRDERVVGLLLGGISLGLERFIDAWPSGWHFHRLVWELHVLHRWTRVIRVLHEREWDRGGIVCISTALFCKGGGVFGA